MRVTEMSYTRNSTEIYVYHNWWLIPACWLAGFATSEQRNISYRGSLDGSNIANNSFPLKKYEYFTYEI